MPFELTFYQVIWVLVVFFAFVFGVWKILDRGRAAEIKTAKDKADEVEKSFLRHLACLPLDYVRREDWIRNQTIIEAKLDGLASKLETLGRGHNGC